MSRLVRTVSVAVPAFALALAPLAPASAKDRPETIALAPLSTPEGITTGPGTTFFAGDIAGGDIYQGDIRTGEVTELIEGREGGAAIGLLYDPSTQRLYVAGGPTGDVTVYDARTGDVLFTANAGAGRFINDVTLTKDAAYFTDSFSTELIVVPLGKGAALPVDGTFEPLALDGVPAPAGFGPNGIRTLPGGDLIVISEGTLYRVDPATGDTDVLEVSGGELVAGDGLELRGNTLYVVRGFNRPSIVQVRLDLPSGTGAIIGELTDPDFETPTTAAFVAGDLYAVNGLSPATPGNPTEVVRVDGT